MKSDMRSVIEGLSFALDAAEKNYFSHSKHVAYLANEFALQLNFTDEALRELYYVALLHDIGAGYVYNLKEHCVVGKTLINRLFENETMAQAVNWHHEFYNGTGPFGLKGDDIPMLSQVVCFANTFDEKFGGETTLDLALKKKMIKWTEDVKALFNPVLMTIFEDLLQRESFLLDYYREDFTQKLLTHITVETEVIETEKLKDVAEIFSKIIDNRSHFTHRHSSELSNIVVKTTKALGYDSEVQDEIYISALLHDLGKLTIQNSIIDKPGKLTDEERFEINKHTYYTRWILEKIAGFENITNYAANHHEKLNGKGYPLRLSAED